jgi:O-antigen/teichoic acid export membrane protein
MPSGLYTGGLMGLQKQVLLNIINSSISTLRGVGAILALWLISPTIQTFLLWQMSVGMLHSFLLFFFLWRNLPGRNNKAFFQKKLLIGIWRFAAGMSGTTIFSIILTQLDKVILSKLLSLETFGYYMLASMIAMSLARLYTPIFYSIYPRFTQLVSINMIDELKNLYHSVCQFFAVLILPASAIIFFYSYELILIWTQNKQTSENTYLIVSIMILGTALNGLTNPAYALELAFGWTKLPFYKNVIAVIALGPMIAYSTIKFGATGAASVWLLLNIGFICIEIPTMHRKILPKEMWHWYRNDVCVPLIVSFIVSGLSRYILNNSWSLTIIFIYIFCVSVITLFSATYATNLTRKWINTKILYFTKKSFSL